MRHLLPITLLMLGLSIVMIFFSGLTWWTYSGGKLTVTPRNFPSSTSLVTTIDKATELEQLRRICRPIAEFHDLRQLTSETIANKMREIFASGIFLAIGAGVLLFFVFGYFYVSLRRLRSKHPESFQTS